MSEAWKFLKALAARPLVVGIIIAAVAAAFIAWRKSDSGS
jgi:hypothetical protein